MKTNYNKQQIKDDKQSTIKHHIKKYKELI